MRETLAENIAWRRRGFSQQYIGTLLADAEGVLLTGRDPDSGIELALSIPASEVDDVRVTDQARDLAGERCVELELAGSDAIFLRQIGAGPLLVHALARRLGELIPAPALIPQGG
jgi:hypothetical protein